MLHIPFVCQRLAALVRNAALVFHNGAAGEPGCSTSLSLPPVSCPAVPGFLRYQCLFSALKKGICLPSALLAVTSSRPVLLSSAVPEPPCSVEGGCQRWHCLHAVLANGRSQLLSRQVTANCFLCAWLQTALLFLPVTLQSGSPRALHPFVTARQDSMSQTIAGQHVTAHHSHALHGAANTKCRCDRASGCQAVAK